MLLNNSHPKYRGDLAFFVNPFWVKQSSSTSNHGTPTTYDTHVPIIFYGKNIKKGVSYNKLNVKDKFLVSPNCFFPKPKVKSIILHFKTKKNNYKIRFIFNFYSNSNTYI